MKKLPRWAYWIDLVLAALLCAAGVFFATSDTSFVNLRPVGGVLLVTGLVLGALDALVLLEKLDGVRLRTAVAFVLVVVPLGLVLTGRPEGQVLSVFALPNFALFWLGLLHLKAQR
jgi:hypothetical protein